MLRKHLACCIHACTSIEGDLQAAQGLLTPGHKLWDGSSQKQEPVTLLMLTGTVEPRFRLKVWLSALTQKQQQQLYQYLAGVAEAKAVSDLDAYAGARGGLHLPVDNHRVDCIPAPLSTSHQWCYRTV